MIGWLQGQRVENWKQGMRKGIVLACSGVGYEVHLLPRHLLKTNSIEAFVLWVHQVQRDDGYSLFGFSEKSERDLFRTLIGVNGVGPQMAMSLMEENPVGKLVEAIIENDYQQLSKAQGVGKRTAERLTVELRNKLSEFQPNIAAITSNKVVKNQPLLLEESRRDELQATLLGLGYEEVEIRRAIKAVAIEKQVANSANASEGTPSPQDSEAWLRASLVWLSQEAA